MERVGCAALGAATALFANYSIHMFSLAPPIIKITIAALFVLGSTLVLIARYRRKAL